MKSEVYFAKVASGKQEERLAALKKLLDKQGKALNYQKNELVPIKATVGESACVYNLNPELLKEIVLVLRQKGAKPFVFDTNVIYHGARQNAVDHLCLAQNKGFGYTEIQAPFIIADGLLGQDGKELEVNARYIKKARVPSFVGMLESLLVISHATGHILSGYAGAIKNVAMGFSCKATKQVMHSSLKPSVIEKKCTFCGLCSLICPAKAISLREKTAFIDKEICIGCGECLCACKFDAILINWQENPLIFAKRMAEVANLILSKFKNKFFINFALDITKDCDCISNKDDKMIAEDIGILSSFDIVSLDKATVDLALKKKKANFLEDTKNNYFGMLEYAEELGLGSLNYNLIEL